MAVGKPLNLRLFAEGIEIPCIAAVVSINVGSASSAAIQVIPLDSAYALKPRTMIHLFFLDTKINTQVSSSSTKTTTIFGSGDLDQYRLLWSGELVGIASVQTPSTRSLVLQCLDFSSYFDAAHALAIEYGPGGNAFTPHVSLGNGGVGLFDDIVNQQPNQLVSWLGQKPQTPGLTSVGGLAGGVIRILEAMGGVVGHHKGINDFFTVGELRCRILAQITAEENDNTSLKVFSVAVFDEWLRNGLQNIGQNVTFRQMLNLLMSYIYYDFVPNPAAKFDNLKQGAVTTVPGKGGTLQTLATMNSVFLNLQDLVTNLTSIQTGVLTNDELPEAAAARQVDITNYVAQIKTAVVSTPAANATLTQVQNDLLRAKLALAPFTVAGSVPSLSGLSTVISAVQDAVNAISNDPRTYKGKNTFKTDATTQRLHTQILRPDCWFVPAPRCNVIFPEHYSQVSFDRNYIAECTRLIVQVYNTLVGQDSLFADFILAPNIGFAANQLTKAQGTSSYRVVMDHELHTGIVPRSEWLPNTSSAGSNLTQTDRKNVKNSRLSWAKRISLFHFFKYRFSTRNLSVGGRFNPYLVAGFPGVVIKKPYIVANLATALSNAQTQVGASAPPGSQNLQGQALIDFLLDNAQNLGAPSQQIGMIQGMQHSLDQSGGTTSVSMSHVRQHQGTDDDFLNIFLQNAASTVTQYVKTTISFQAAESATDDSLYKLLSGSTPQSGGVSSGSIPTRNVTQVSSQVSKMTADPSTGTLSSSPTTVTSSVTNETGSSSNPSPSPAFTVVGQIQAVSRDNCLLPSPPGKLTVGSKGRYGGTIIGIEVVDPSIQNDVKYGGKLCYGAVSIYEQVTINTTTNLPVEEILRPPWFSNNYANINIGANIYGPFFGCGSVVDDLINGQTLLPSGSSSNSPDVTDFSSDQTPAQVIQSLQGQASTKSSVSIDRGVTLLSYVYGQVKSTGQDADSFVRAYTNRPIASITDILGDPNLDFTVGANGVATPTDPSLKIGFHSTSVNRTLVQAGNLAGLLQDPLLTVPRINTTGKDAAIPPGFDVRKAKQDMVTAYVAELSTGPGFRG